MPSIRDCLVKLASTGQISRAKADEAEALYIRSLAEYSMRHLGPADAQAAAALATAKTLANGARQTRNDVAKQALAYADREREQFAYPHGKRAYVMDKLTPSLRGEGTRNVQTKTENIWNYFVNRLGDEMRHFATAFYGRTGNQVQMARNVVRELHGVQTGDAIAAPFAKSYSSVTDEGALRARSGGKRFPFNRDWVMPQQWDAGQTSRVGEAEFVSDFNQHVQSGALRLWNKEKDRWALPGEELDLLKKAYDDITIKGGTARPFDPLERTFNFARNDTGADAHLELMQKYGVGDDIMGLLLGHLNKMAREIAFTEEIGPNHQAIMSGLLRHAQREQREARRGLGGLREFRPRSLFESTSAIERTYKVLTGEADQISSEFWAGVTGAVRSINSAAKLPYAVVASVPGDTVNAALAEFHTGMMPGRIIGGMAAEMARGPLSEQKALAQRLMVTSHAVAEMNQSLRFYSGQVEANQTLGAVSTGVIRAGGLQYWSDIVKRTFSLEMLAHLSEISGKSLADLKAAGGANGRTARFLEKYGINDFDWDHIRQSQHLDVGGAKYIDPEQLDRAIREKLLEGIIQERRYALLEPSARVRAIGTGGGLPRGTWMGEIARNAILFKSFPMTMMETWMARAASQGTVSAGISVGTQIALMTTFAGAMAIQAKSVLQGKDIQDMTTANFWVRAFLEGGAVGPISSVLTGTVEAKGYQRGAVGELLLGPVGGTLEDFLTLGGESLKIVHGKGESNLGRATVKALQHLSPATFYTKLAMDRLVWDQLQRYLDHKYGESFQRARKFQREQTGAKFWWGPGDTVPPRPPGISGPPVDRRNVLNRPLF